MNRDYIIQLNKISQNLLNAIYGKSYQLVDDIRVEALPSYKTKYYVQIGLRNLNYQCMIIIGLSQDVCMDLLNDVLQYGQDDFEKQEIMKSALGEFANTCACSMIDINELVLEYGKLFPTPPLVWVTDGKLPDFIPSDGASGCLSNDKKKFYTHFSALKLEGSKNGNSQNWNPTQSLSIYDPTVIK